MAPRHGIPGTHPGLNYVLRLASLEQREQWDRFVTHSAGGHLLQSWGWGELKARAGWSPLRLALYDDDEIIAAAQVLRRLFHRHRRARGAAETSLPWLLTLPSPSFAEDVHQRNA